MGLICERNEAPRDGVVQPLLHLVASELDEDVLWSAARALGSVANSLALPALLALAQHPVTCSPRQVANRRPQHVGGSTS